MDNFVYLLHIWRVNSLKWNGWSGVNAVVILLNIAKLSSIGDCAILHIYQQCLCSSWPCLYSMLLIVLDYCQPSRGKIITQNWCNLHFFSGYGWAYFCMLCFFSILPDILCLFFFVSFFSLISRSPFSTEETDFLFKIRQVFFCLSLHMVVFGFIFFFNHAEVLAFSCNHIRSEVFGGLY